MRKLLTRVRQGPFRTTFGLARWSVGVVSLPPASFLLLLFFFCESISRDRKSRLFLLPVLSLEQDFSAAKLFTFGTVILCCVF